MRYSYARCPDCKMLVKVIHHDNIDKQEVPAAGDNDPEIVAAVLKGLPVLKHECEICYQKKFNDYFVKQTRGVTG